VLESGEHMSRNLEEVLDTSA